jgi:signal transduction histidine kinase
VWSVDIAGEPEFLWAASARTDGLRTAVFIPLAASGRTLGVVELYRREAAAPDREIIDGLALIGHAIATHLERVHSRSELEVALRVLDAELQDRESKLAREIHDILGQELTGLKLDAAWVVRRLSGAPIDPPALVERLEAMSRSIDGVLQTVRRIATDLRAGVLDDLGLTAAIESLARELAARSGLAIELALEPPPGVDRAVATAVFRGVQELLTNIVRHAGARRVAISLRGVRGFLELRVRDDGAGIDPAAVRSPSSLGLLGIRERALAYGGTFEIAPCEGGTEAVLQLPRASAEDPR